MRIVRAGLFADTSVVFVGQKMSVAILFSPRVHNKSADDTDSVSSVWSWSRK